MKALLWITMALLVVSPVMAQEEDGGGFFGGFSADDSDFPSSGESGRQRDTSGERPHPVDQLDAILAKGGAPLTIEQKQMIQAKLQEQIESLPQSQAGADAPAGRQTRPAASGRAPESPAGADTPGGAGGRNPDQNRRQEERFIASFLPVLTPPQTTVWKSYEREQIRARGGYPALRLALEEAGTPPAPEQEAPIQEVFGTYARQQRELRRAAGPDGAPDAAKMKEAETQYLSELIQLLNAEQRQALIEWRSKQQPPR